MGSTFFLKLSTAELSAALMLPADMNKIRNHPRRAWTNAGRAWEWARSTEERRRRGGEGDVVRFTRKINAPLLPVLRQSVQENLASERLPSGAERDSSSGRQNTNSN